jgi:hypothetical protein
MLHSPSGRSLAWRDALIPDLPTFTPERVGSTPILLTVLAPKRASTPGHWAESKASACEIYPLNIQKSLI